jgi:hypothetical protein
MDELPMVKASGSDYLSSPRLSLPTAATSKQAPSPAAE